MTGESPLPLGGRRFLVTRPADQAAPFVAQINALGGEAICLPTIEIVPPASYKELDLAVGDLDTYQMVILTSVNAVQALFARMLENNQYFGLLRQLELVVVGPKTAEALAQYKLRPTLMPVDHRAEGMVKELLAREVTGKRILYPRAAAARPLLAAELRAAGATVIDPIAYQTVIPQENTEKIRSLLAAGELDAICFSSSSTFRHLHQMLGADLAHLKGTSKFFSIGPQTSQTIREGGFEVDLEPETWTMDALLQAMVNYYR
ncbi:uroporphyrinogen-III synthase [Pelovirga terrestris]|uniref:Uroporphyrinogen-III synthase n=1 Tax=Pelovirga terrestris TaxID=2771352 RepID=A0A8J6QXH3_9BACT|nr:uroporphyrinogen-III synthase [Pelovirga terrestris]MBD1400716.1 uroporphyrinogen-III synthase [Pelovirga terrestris]